jgi:hypothetical protein
MSRNPQLEAVFAARYAWETAAGRERPELRNEYHRLLDEALARSGFESAGRKALEDYQEFRRAKRQEERAKLSRLR